MKTNETWTRRKRRLQISVFKNKFLNSNLARIKHTVIYKFKHINKTYYNIRFNIIRDNNERKGWICLTIFMVLYLFKIPKSCDTSLLHI